jgi:PTH1 family peptidyl-tRNA hydrolase
MNNSGLGGLAVLRFYRVYNQNSLAVYVELALPYGQLRTRVGGAAAGHNGVKSLIQHIGGDFGRLRIGIGAETSEAADASGFVLGKFVKNELENLPQIIREANAILTEYIFGGQLSEETRKAF